MPKTGPSTKDWLLRLKLFAQGSYTFQRGQRPARTSVWWKELNRIEACPRHGTAGKDLFKRVIECKCGYHVSDNIIIVTFYFGSCFILDQFWYCVKVKFKI